MKFIDPNGKCSMETFFKFKKKLYGGVWEIESDMPYQEYSSIRCAPKSQDFVDYRTHKTGKMLTHVKYSSKKSNFLRYYAYLCHVIDDFCLS